MDVQGITSNTRLYSVLNDTNLDNRFKSSFTLSNNDGEESPLKNLVSPLSETEEYRMAEESKTHEFRDSYQDFSSKRIHFKVNESSGRTTVVVVDAESNEVLQEIPPENLLKVTEKLKQFFGMMFDEKA